MLQVSEIILSARDIFKKKLYFKFFIKLKLNFTDKILFLAFTLCLQLVLFLSTYILINVNYTLSLSFILEVKILYY